MRLKTLYAALLCISFATSAFGGGAEPVFGQTKPSGPADKASESPLQFEHPVIYALSLGTDERANSGLATTLAKDLIEHKPVVLPTGSEQYPWIVPEGGWDLARYETQCASDPNTRGAFVLLSPAAGAAVENYIALMRSNLYVRFSVMLVECKHGDNGAASPNPHPNQVVWVSEPKTGINGRTSMEFFPLAIFTSMYLAFAPQRIFSVVSVVAHPTPNPLPPTGVLVSTSTTSSTTMNASGTSQQSNILQAFDQQNSTGTTIGQPPATEVQTVRAAEDAINSALKELIGYCKPPKGPLPDPKPWFCDYIGPKH